jgi:hypothetical protein
MAVSEDNLRALTAFAAVAEEYCAFIDALADGRPPSLYTRLEALLARLGTAILPVEKDMPDKERRKFETMGMTHEEHVKVAMAIAAVVQEQAAAIAAEHQELRTADQTGDDYCQVRAEMLWDDLAGVYRELRDGLVLWRLGTPDAQAEASWEWRYGYEIHWGDHLFRAMTTVHEARYRIYQD